MIYASGEIDAVITRENIRNVFKSDVYVGKNPITGKLYVSPTFAASATEPDDGRKEKNINTITCGGQASIPLAYALGTVHPNIEYIEVVSAIASKSAGPGTRANLDEYIETTEKGIQLFSKCKKSKVILILNPAR